MEPLTIQVIIAFIFGVLFIVAMLVLAIKFPKPTIFQYNIFRVVFALAGAGVAAMTPGFINLEASPSVGLLIRAGGALAVFVIIFFFNPAQLKKVSQGEGKNRIILSIPAGWTFEDAARSIVSIATAVISFEGFEPEQLTQKLRATEINTTDVQEALLQLRYQATHLPAYKVHFEKGVYHIRV